MRFLRRVWDWLDFWVFDTAFFDAFVVCGWVGLLGLYVLRFVSLRAFFFWILWGGSFESFFEVGCLLCEEKGILLLMRRGLSRLNRNLLAVGVTIVISREGLQELRKAT